MSELRQYVLDNKSMLVRETVKATPDATLVVDDTERTPVFWAVSQNNPEITALLLQAASKLPKFNIDQVDEAGWTLLHVAAAIGNPDIVELVLTYKPDINARTNGGQTPLFQAVSKQHFAVVEALLSAGASVSAKDKSGQTSLQRAAAAGSLQMVKKLLEHGAPINASDNDGWTALHYAYAEGFPEVVLFLIRGGADVDKENKEEQKPAQVAVDLKTAKYVAQELKGRDTDDAPGESAV